jgi:hypothetical protein
MYKKVTHNITEEHFDHPMAQEIKKMVDHGAKTSAAWPPGAKSWQLTSQLKSQFDQFNTALRNVIVGSTANDPALAYNKQQLSDLTAAFGPFFEPYYGQSAAEAVVSHMADFVKSINDMITAAKNNGDWNTVATQAKDHLLALASLITSWNPTWWNNRTISLRTYLDQYAQAVTSQVISRAAQNWAKDITQYELARQIITNGPLLFSPFNNAPAAPDLASQLSFMITQQFPDKFST